MHLMGLWISASGDTSIYIHPSIEYKYSMILRMDAHHVHWHSNMPNCSSYRYITKSCISKVYFYWTSVPWYVWYLKLILSNNVCYSTRCITKIYLHTATSTLIRLNYICFLASNTNTNSISYMVLFVKTTETIISHLSSRRVCLLIHCNRTLNHRLLRCARLNYLSAQGRVSLAGN